MSNVPRARSKTFGLRSAAGFECFLWASLSSDIRILSRAAEGNCSNETDACVTLLEYSIRRRVYALMYIKTCYLLPEVAPVMRM